MAIDKRFISSIDQSAFSKANERGRKVLARGPLAISVKYKDGRIHVELNNGCAFIFPAAHAQELVGAKAAQLHVIEITSAGLGLYWPKLDADLYVPTLVKGVLGTKDWMAKIGASGGSATTPAKAVASRANGKLGGRPRSVTKLEAAS
jgi:Protein of unknown function (DUF2442)